MSYGAGIVKKFFQTYFLEKTVDVIIEMQYY
jgi:hypothetical protein